MASFMCRLRAARLRPRLAAIVSSVAQLAPTAAGFIQSWTCPVPSLSIRASSVKMGATSAITSQQKSPKCVELGELRAKLGQRFANVGQEIVVITVFAPDFVKIVSTSNRTMHRMSLANHRQKLENLG